MAIAVRPNTSCRRTATAGPPHPGSRCGCAMPVGTVRCDGASSLERALLLARQRRAEPLRAARARDAHGASRPRATVRAKRRVTPRAPRHRRPATRRVTSRPSPRTNSMRACRSRALAIPGQRRQPKRAHCRRAWPRGQPRAAQGAAAAPRARGASSLTMRRAMTACSRVLHATASRARFGRRNARSRSARASGAAKQDARIAVAIIQIHGDDELLPATAIGLGEQRAAAVGER